MVVSVSSLPKSHTKSIKQECETHSQLESLKTSIKTKTSDYNFIAIPSTKKIDFIKIDDILDAICQVELATPVILIGHITKDGSIARDIHYILTIKKLKRTKNSNLDFFNLF